MYVRCLFRFCFRGNVLVRFSMKALVSHTKSTQTTLSDISFHYHDTLRFNLKQSKNNQFGFSHPIFLFRLNSYLSLYEPILAYLHQRKPRHSSHQDPLFITKSGGVTTHFWFHHNLLPSLLPKSVTCFYSTSLNAA